MVPGVPPPSPPSPHSTLPPFVSLHLWELALDNLRLPYVGICSPALLSQLFEGRNSAFCFSGCNVVALSRYSGNWQQLQIHSLGFSSALCTVCLPFTNLPHLKTPPLPFMVLCQHRFHFTIISPSTVLQLPQAPARRSPFSDSPHSCLSGPYDCFEPNHLP